MRVKKMTLGFKTAISVALPMLIIIIIVIAVNSVITFRSANAQLAASVQNTAADDIALITENLWQLDLNALQEKLDAYVKVGQITGAKIADDDGLLLQAGFFGHAPRAYVATYDLVYQRTSSQVTLGVLTLEASRSQTWAQTELEVLKFAALALVMVAVSFFLINRLLDQLVLSPIKKISIDLHQRPEDWSKFQIDLGPMSDARELNELIMSIHEMRDQILTSFNKIEQSQLRLAHAAEMTGLGYATADLVQDRMLVVDENFANLLGRTVEELLTLSIQKDLVEFSSNSTDIEQARHRADLLMKGESFTATDPFQLENGKVRYVKRVCTFRKDLGDQDVIVDIAAQDVTEIFEMREQLLQSQKMKSIGQLTGGVAHDFNNLLAVILGNLELLRDDNDPAAQTGMIEAAITATLRGADLTRNMLAFARKAPLRPEVMDLNRVVRDAKNWMARALPESVVVETSLLAGLWPVEADRTSLESALLNLTLNARDAMEGQGNLTIETANVRIDEAYIDSRHEELAPGRYVMVAVSDTGPGIPDEVIGSIFEPFFTTKPPGVGSGLGLAMTVGFMQQSGGTVQVYSEIGVGTTFKLYFPAGKAQIADPDKAVSESSGAVGGGKKLLLAEDEEAVRTTLVTVLERAGYHVTAAISGDAAFAIFDADPTFDMLLTDIVMPGTLQGTGLAKALRENWPDLPVLFMSGYASEATVHGNGLKPEDIRLMKPVRRAELLAAVNKVLASSKT